MGTTYLLPTIALAGTFDGPDTWSSTFPFCWMVFLVTWVGPAALILSCVAALIHRLKRKADSFPLLLKTFLAYLIGLLLFYTIVLAVLFAFTANFEQKNETSPKNFIQTKPN
jgi:hypothetical protein